MKKTVNIFDQYSQLENRLTHALAVTLKRSKPFRSAFISRFSPKAQLGKNPEITLQLAKGRPSGTSDEISGIPDLAIIDDNDQAIIIESKVGANLQTDQLQGHENRARYNGLYVQSALAVTGRNEDQASRSISSAGCGGSAAGT